MSRPRDLLVILAAGKSARISQLSFDRPKTLLSVAGQSLLERLCLMFAPSTDKFIVVAGRNRDPVVDHLVDLALDIEVIGGDELTDQGSAASLAAGLNAARGDFGECRILESDVVLSDIAVETFLSSPGFVRTITIPVRDPETDDKLYKGPSTTGWQISKEIALGAKLLGKFLGVTALPFGTAKALADTIPTPCERTYTDFVAACFPDALIPIPLRAGLAAEIDTGRDYEQILLDPLLGKRVAPLLGPNRAQGHLALEGSLKRWIGVHDVLGARLASRSGFDGVWLGSFQIALASGGRDDASYEPMNALGLAEQIQQAGNLLPIVVDAANGWSDPSRESEFVERAVQAGVAAVCLEDNDAGRVCSLYTTSDRQLVSVAAFEARIGRLVELAAGRLQVIARTEALTVSLSGEEAAARLNAAASAGAAALLPHYVGCDVGLIRDFLSEHSFPRPLILVPSGLMGLPAAEFKVMGCAAIVYANVDLRLRFKRLREVYARLSAEAALAQDLEAELADPARMRELLED